MPKSIPSVRSGAREERRYAVDTCWGVPVLAALCALLVCLPATFMALLFSFMVEDYGVSREGASWPMNVFTMAMQLAGLLISLLQRRISITNIIILSCFISSVGITASAFTRDVYGLTITIGVIYGCGMGTFVTSAIVFNLRLFDKYKGTAVGFTFIAWAAGGMYGPAVFTYFHSAYGFNGALLLTGGLLWHSVPLSMLLRNPDFLTPKCLSILRRKLSAKVLEKSVKSDVDATSISPQKESESTALFHEEITSNGTLKIPTQAMNPPSSKLKATESLVEGLKKSNNANGALRQGQDKEAAKSVFKAPGFYVCMFATMVGEYSLLSFGTTIVDFAVGKGIALNIAMNLVTSTSVGQLIGRLFLVPLSDLCPASRWPLYATSYVLIALCILATPYVGTIGAILALRVAESASQGFAASVRGILLAQLLGVDAVAFCTGLFGAAMVPVWLTNPRIIGFFRDGMGSYNEFYRMLGAVNISAAVITTVFFVCNWKTLVQKRRRDLGVPEQDTKANPA